MLDQVEVSYQGEPVPTQKTVDAVLSWVNQYGLLGVLLQESRAVFFPPVVRMERGVEDPEAQKVPTWILGHYFRESDRWRVYRELYSPTIVGAPKHRGGTGGHARVYGHCSDAEFEVETDHLSTSPECDKKTAGRVPRDWPGPHVLARDLGGSQWFRRPLDDYWFRYFPGISDHTMPTPRPLSDEFWQVYAEPLDTFVRAAVLLRMAFEWHVNPLPLPRKGRRSPGVTIVHGPEDATRKRFRGLGLYSDPPDDLKRMLDGVSPTLETTGSGGTRKYRQVWKAPSLLGMLAAMLMQDLAGGRDLRV